VKIDWVEFFQSQNDTDLIPIIDAAVYRWGLKGLLRATAEACARRASGIELTPGFWARSVRVVKDARDQVRVWTETEKEAKP